MKKGKSITLLTIICVIMAILIAMVFVSFQFGVKDYNSVLGSIETDYDISGGTVYELKLADDNTKAVENVDDVIKTLKSRLNSLGYENNSVKAVRPASEDNADYSIRIEVKGSNNEYGSLDYATLDADVRTASLYGELEFFGGASANPTDKILEGEKVISSATNQTFRNGDELQYVVTINFTDKAYDYISKKMEDGSYYFKVTLGGEVLSPFDGASALTSSSFGKSLYLTSPTEAGAKQVALQISSGGLAYKYDAPVRVGESTSILGEKSEIICLASVLAVFVLIVIFLMIKYKGFGIASALNMLLFLIIETYMLVAVPGVKLSLGGVVGIIMALVLAMDGCILTSKRISEEFESGKTVKAAFKNGFNRAIYPVLNTVIVAGITALALFFIAQAEIKGFAITFGIGCVIALLTGLVFEKMFAYLLLGSVSKKEAFFNLKREAE